MFIELFCNLTLHECRCRLGLVDFAQLLDSQVGSHLEIGVGKLHCSLDVAGLVGHCPLILSGCIAPLLQVRETVSFKVVGVGIFLVPLLCILHAFLNLTVIGSGISGIVCTSNGDFKFRILLGKFPSLLEKVLGGTLIAVLEEDCALADIAVGI